MPKKRFQGQYSKPQSTVHPSLASASSASASHNNAGPTVNDLIVNLRKSQLTPDNLRTASPVVTRTLPPNVRQLLAQPETPAPTPRARTRPRFDENGRRLPSGPPPPRSWLSGSRHAPESMKTYSNERLYPHDIEHLPGLPDSEDGEMGLRNMCLRHMARNWDFIKVYESNNLADLPTALRIRLMSYIALYGPEEGIGHDGLKNLVLIPSENEQEEEFIEHQNPGESNYDFYRLDLSGSVGRSVTFKQLSDLVRQDTTAEADDMTESWEKSMPRSLDAPIPHLTHLSLSHPPPNISWTRFLAFSKLVPTLTHLSLAYWPPPCLTPNALTTVMTSPNAPTVQYGGTNIYSYTLDNDFTEAALILKRLATALYGLVYIDLDGCCEWSPALRLHTAKSSQGIDWRVQWPLLKTINLRSGWELDASSSLQDMLQVRKANDEANSMQSYLAKLRQGQQWVEVNKEDLEAKYNHLWTSDADRQKRRAMGLENASLLRAIRRINEEVNHDWEEVMAAEEANVNTWDE
ncbi:hypothetical protein F5884DRAFT_432500 [Xylogone sp. PMI_703]|nr:hypothetical protein F5884DRAFT_432500 [Xylogone sp. PMI_703]